MLRASEEVGMLRANEEVGMVRTTARATISGTRKTHARDPSGVFGNLLVAALLLVQPAAAASRAGELAGDLEGSTAIRQAAHKQADSSERWKGVMELPGMQMDFTVTFTPDSEGGYSATIDILAQGVSGLVLVDVVYTGVEIRFTIAQAPPSGASLHRDPRRQHGQRRAGAGRSEVCHQDGAHGGRGGRCGRQPPAASPTTLSVRRARGGVLEPRRQHTPRRHVDDSRRFRPTPGGPSHLGLRRPRS